MDARIWYLAIVTFINRAGAMVLPFLSLYLSQELGFSLSTTGTVLLCFGIGSFLGNYLGGLLTDKLGAFRLQVLSLLGSGLAFLFLLQFKTPFGFGMALLLTSMVMDMFRPANMAAVAILAGPEKRTKAVGVIRLAINIGFAAGPASGGFIAFNWGYSSLFLIDASTCFLASILMFIVFYRVIIGEGAKCKEQEKVGRMADVFKDRLFLYFLVIVFVIACVFMQFFNAVPVFFKQELSIQENWIGALMALNGLLIVLFELPIIELFKKKKNMPLISLGCILLGIAYGLLYFDTWQGISALCLVFFTIGEIFVLPYTTTAIMNRAPEHLRGRYLALYGMAFSLCHMVAPVLGLGIADHFGFPILWIGVALLIGLAACLVYQLKGLEQEYK